MAFQRYILVCGGAGCHDNASEGVFRGFIHEIEAKELQSTVQVVKAGCFGFCEKGPVVKILPDEKIYVGVGVDDIRELVSEHVVGGRFVTRLLYDESESKQHVRVDDLDFY